MYGINSIIKKIILDNHLTENVRAEILNSQQADPNVLKYLTERLENVIIEIGAEYHGRLLELMKSGVLTEWSLPTTETSIMFFDDNDYIERGMLNLYLGSDYHSWICFKYSDVEYVFDPCLDLLCKKDLYKKVFEPKVEGIITCREVKEDFLYRLDSLEEKPVSLLDEYLYQNEIKAKDKKVHINGTNEVNSPMYQNNTGYTVELDNRKIKRLVAHYYYRTGNDNRLCLNNRN